MNGNERVVRLEIPFKVWFFLIAIVFIMTGLLMQQDPGFFKIGMIMFVLWIVASIILIILELEK